MYFLGEQKTARLMAIAINHHHLKGLRSPVGVPKFGVKNSWLKIQKKTGPTWPETGPTWPKSPGLDPPFRCPFPFRTSEGHLELSLVVFWVTFKEAV